MSVSTNIPGRSPIELPKYYEQFRWYYPNCEMQTKKWFVDYIGQDWTILDCGANIGYFTILFSQLAPRGRIYAFEPTATYDMMLANLAYNKALNVTALKVAVGNKCGRLVDGIFRVWGDAPESLEYDFTTIDEFVRLNNITRLDCIKIDTDSYDFEVLQGAASTMKSLNPFVVVELNHALLKRNQNVRTALEWMKQLGYTACSVLDGENFLFKFGLGGVDINSVIASH